VTVTPAPMVDERPTSRAIARTVFIVVLCAAAGRMKRGFAIAIAYQQFENYVVQPRIQSKVVSIDPFIVVIAALLGGTLLGVVGALLAIPGAATIQITLREYFEYKGMLPRPVDPEDLAIPAA
jgi:predicted PurR-regulated permease PerM